MITIKQAVKEFLEQTSYGIGYENLAKSLASFRKVENIELSLPNLLEWAKKGTRHVRNPQSPHRIGFVRTFVKFTNSHGLSDLVFPYVNVRKEPPKKAEPINVPFQKSAASDLLEQYVSYKRSANAMSENTHQCLRYFNNYCTKYFIHDALTEEMVAGWCCKRESELPSSYNKRIAPIRSFLHYTNKSGLTYLSLPPYLPYEKKKFIPHPFSSEELRLFFEYVDTLSKSDRAMEFTFRIRKMVLPVFFRLLYSTGMRTCEARNLKCEDIDLNSGVINIQHSKGAGQHRVSLHETMWNLLKQYNTAINRLLPNRIAFFPNEFGTFLPRTWEAYHFNAIWKHVSESPARAYDFRSNYAVTNINRWEYAGPEWFDKLLYLSRSMGHVSIQSTTYYYNLVPLFAEQLTELTACGLSEILPDLTKYYAYEEE